MFHLLFMVTIFIYLWLFKECFTVHLGVLFAYSNDKCFFCTTIYTILLFFIGCIFNKSILLIISNYNMFDYLLIICVPVIVLISIYSLKNHIENYLYYKELSIRRNDLLKDREKLLLKKSKIIHTLLSSSDKINCRFCTGNDIRDLDRPFEKIYVCKNCGRSFRIDNLT